MIVAIDYDDTFTLDGKMWSSVVREIKAAGHDIFMVTARRNTNENVDQINSHLDCWDCQMPIILTEGRAKRPTMEGRGIKVDVWIDDHPEGIANDR